MKDRIFRFGVSGLIFLLSFAFGFWLLGGTNISSIFLIAKGNILSSTLITIVSAPALGFIISSLNIEIWEKIHPSEKIFILASNKTHDKFTKDYLKIIFDNFPEHSGIELTDKEYKIAKKDFIFLNHQILLRTQKDNSEIIAFATRRMDVFYAHLNAVYSIVIGVLTGFIFYFFIYGFHFESVSKKIIWLIPVILYIIVGFLQAKKALQEANNFEKLYLLSKFSNKKC